MKAINRADTNGLQAKTLIATNDDLALGKYHNQPYTFNVILIRILTRP